MDALVHIFLPLTLLYVIWREFYEEHPYAIFLSLFGIFPDLDKFFLNAPRFLHSILTLIPIVLVAFLILRKLTSHYKKYTSIIAVFLFAHLLLDVVGHSHAPIFYPLMDSLIGFEYPMVISFGEGLLGVSIEGVPVRIVTEDPVSGVPFDASPLTGFGVASFLLFILIFIQSKVGEKLRSSKPKVNGES